MTVPVSILSPAETISRGIGGHHSPNQGKTDDWLTPPFIIEALGPFDLDPCASRGQPWRTGKIQISLPLDGLRCAWLSDQFIWCNPPYGPETWAWLSKLAEHGSGIALIFARTETKGFFEQVWNKADTLLFIEGRLFFHHPSGERAAHNSGGPSVLVGYGGEASFRLNAAHALGTIQGSLVEKWTTPTQ